MEKIKYSVALILFASSILSQNQSLENPDLVKIERIADSLVQICEFDKPIDLYKELVKIILIVLTTITNWQRH